MKVIFILLGLSSLAFGWEGYSYEKDTEITIESYDHRNRGEGPVEYFDHKEGEYKIGYLDMRRGGQGTITDDESGESFDVEME